MDAGRVQLLVYCRGMYAYKPDMSAGRYFARLRPAQIQRQLVPLRQSLRRGSPAYSSVAYVLAYYGIDVEQNVKRLLLVWNPPRALPSGAWPGQERDGFNGVEVSLPCVERLYKRHPQRGVLRQLLTFDRDGTASEGPDYYVTDMFLAYPLPMLRAAGEGGDGAMRQLAESVAWAGVQENPKHKGQWDDYSKVYAAIRRAEHQGDPSLKKVTCRFRRMFEKAIRNR
jgi:hypothetical protein